MTRKYFTELANYNNWTDNITIEWLKKITDEQWEQPIESSFSSIAKTATHIVSAKRIWIEFWTKANPNSFGTHNVSCSFCNTTETALNRLLPLFVGDFF